MKATGMPFYIIPIFLVLINLVMLNCTICHTTKIKWDMNAHGLRHHLWTLSSKLEISSPALYSKCVTLSQHLSKCGGKASLRKIIEDQILRSPVAFPSFIQLTAMYWTHILCRAMYWAFVIQQELKSVLSTRETQISCNGLC